MLVKLALKNNMYNTIKLETQNQRVHQSTQGQLLSENYQYSLHRGWTSYEILMYVQIRVHVYWVAYYMAQRGAQTSIPHKNHFIRPDPIRWNPGQLGFVPLFFPRLKLYNILKLNLFYSGLKVLDCFCFELFSAALYIAFKVFSITIWWCATSSCPHCKFKNLAALISI